MELLRLESLPPNFRGFADEIAPGVARLYGQEAGAAYRVVAAANLSAQLKTAGAAAYAVGTPDEAAGMIVGVQRDEVGRITLLHVLKRFTGRGVENLLVEALVEEFRHRGLPGVVCECLPFCEIDAAEAFAGMGFTTIRRLLMMAPLDASGLAPPSQEGGLCEGAALQDAAQVIVDAYAGDPGRELHAEVRSQRRAHRFLEQALAGRFGTVRPGYVRMLSREGQPAAVVVGCEVAPGVGFVLQVAVAPRFRGAGLATQLIRELAERFRQAGLTRVGLGVTVSNPARRLYERLGFETVRPVDAFVWWRD